MSIIHEALKKVQANLSTPSPTQPEDALEQEAPSNASPTPPTRINKKPFSMALMLLSVIAFAACWFLAVQIKRYFPNVLTIKPSAYGSKTSPASGPLARIPQQAHSPQLNIQGVMAQGDTNLVLINKDIYQQGDQIEGYTIISIAFDKIVVKKDGEETTITLRK